MTKILRVLVLVVLALGALSGCARFSYDTVDKFATMEECRVAFRLKEISHEELFECVVQDKPETLKF